MMMMMMMIMMMHGQGWKKLRKGNLPLPSFSTSSDLYIVSAGSDEVCGRYTVMEQKRYVDDPHLVLMQHTTLTFHWAIAVGGAIHESDVQVRADHAAERGVPFPATWKSELGLGSSRPIVDVEALAHGAVRLVREDLSLPEEVELSCRLVRTRPHACVLLIALGL